MGSALTLFTAENDKVVLAKDWLIEGRRSVEDLRSVLIFFADENYKHFLARGWLIEGETHLTDPETRYRRFLTTVESDVAFSNKYDTANIGETFGADPILRNRCIDLCKDLYPLNELLQTELLQVLISSQNDESLNANKESLKSFIGGLHEDDYAAEILSAAEQKIEITPLEILEIAKGRLDKKYQSIISTLNTQSLEQSFVEEGLKTLTETFSNIPEGTTVSDIFCYYNLKQDFAAFISLLQPSAALAMSENFSPSDQSPYISEKEFAKLKTLLETDPNHKFELPSLSILGEYLNGVVTNKIGSTHLNEEKINQFRFGKSVLLEANYFEEEESKFDSYGEEESKDNFSKTEALADHFKSLLNDQDPSVENVINFFTKALGNEEEILQGQSQKLTTFFAANKNLLAILFAKDGGLDQFARIAAELTQGCVANIATQFRNALYASLLEDSHANQALFGLFQEKIANPILNSGGDHLTGSPTGINIFTDHFIAQNYISPNGLAKALAKEFYDSDQRKPQIRSTSLVLCELLEEDGEEKAVKLFEEENSIKNALKRTNIDEIAADLAAYLILQKVDRNKNILESKCLADFKSEMESVLQTISMRQEQSPNPNTSPQTLDGANRVSGPSVDKAK